MALPTKARYYLRNKGVTEHQIFLKMKYKRREFFFYTGFRIKEDNWDKEVQRVKAGRKNCNTINNFLDGLAEDAEAKLSELRAALSKTVLQDLKQYLKEKYRPEQLAPIVEAPKIQFWELFTNIQTERTINDETQKEGSIKKYNSLRRHLELFEKKKRYKITFESVNAFFYSNFLKFLRKDCNLSESTVSTRVSSLCAVMREGLRLKLHENKDYEFFRKPKQVEADTIYLKMNEIETLETLDLSDNPKLDNVRDWFLFGVWTYQRFSDFIDLQPYQIKENGITITQKKTGTKVLIPVHKWHRHILNKYNGELPKPISRQRFSDYLKELCKFAGFTTKHKITTEKGGKTQTNTKFKWELVASHLCRRTGLTHLYLETKSPIECMRISGHTTERNFLKYVRINLTEVSAEIKKSSLYTEKNMKKVS